jgi:hypothetical protein
VLRRTEIENAVTLDAEFRVHRIDDEESVAFLGTSLEYSYRVLLRAPFHLAIARSASQLERTLYLTIVRAPKLTNERRAGDYRSGESVRGRWPVPLMSRADVADFMLQQLVDPRYVRQAPAIVH